MSRAFSSKKASCLPPPPTPTSTTAKLSSNRRRSPRSPLQDLYRISSSSNGSDASSSVSTEVPKGCLGFLASSSFKTPVNKPKNITKTPNSGSHGLVLKQSKSHSSKENLPNDNKIRLQIKTLVPNKAKKNPPCLYQWQSGKKTGSKPGQKSKLSSALNENGKKLSAPKESKKKEDINAVESARLKSSYRDLNSSPLSKRASGSDLDVTVYREAEDNLNRSVSKTPPIHNSLSPEIQGSSSLVSTTTPACYGAGYIVSGVTDKRKCRPRGILTVDENYSGSARKVANSIDDDDGGDDDDDDDDDEKKAKDVIKEDSPSLLPSPTEALVYWLSSPRSKGDKILNHKSEIGLIESITLGSSTSPSSSSKRFWNLCDSSKTFWNASDSSDLSSAANNGTGRKMSSSISPGSLSEFQVPFDSILFSPKSSPKRRTDSSENLVDENSPFTLNSIGSGDVIRTPQSDSSSDLHVELSLAHADNQKEDDFNPYFNSFSDVLLSDNLLRNSSVPLEDSVNSSFQFDCLTMPYESIELGKLPNELNGQEPWLSSSTIGNGSQSEMRISWREGLMSQVNEIDEFDSCRCLSDEEDLADNGCDSDNVSGTQVNIEVDDSKKPNYDVGLAKTEDKELEIDSLGKVIFSGAESISMDEGSVVASRDDLD